MRAAAAPLNLHSHEHRRNREKLWWLLEELFTEHWLSCDSRTLARRAISFASQVRLLIQQVPNGLHLQIIAPQSRTHDAQTHCTCAVALVVCTQPQILGYWCFNLAARLQLLSPLFVSMDTIKLGLMLQAMNFTGVYVIFTSVFGKQTPPDQSDHSICYNYDLIGYS